MVEIINEIQSEKDKVILVYDFTRNTFVLIDSKDEMMHQVELKSFGNRLMKNFIEWFWNEE